MAFLWWQIKKQSVKKRMQGLNLLLAWIALHFYVLLIFFLNVTRSSKEYTTYQKKEWCVQLYCYCN